MNNRYTYKAKRKDNGEWYFGCLSAYYQGGLTEITGDFGTKEVKKETLCQCTGLQDIEGNYIFENDIVEDIDTGDICYLVVFDEAKFKLNKNSVNYDIDGVSDFKIISNIFDKEAK